MPGSFTGFIPSQNIRRSRVQELALRKRFESDLSEEDLGGQKPTLSPLLRYAIKHGHIKHEGFRRWHEAAL